MPSFFYCDCLTVCKAAPVKASSSVSVTQRKAARGDDMGYNYCWYRKLLGELHHINVSIYPIDHTTGSGNALQSETHNVNRVDRHLGICTRFPRLDVIAHG